MTLVNAFTTCPETLEERIQLREELSRRGLNEIIVVCKDFPLICWSNGPLLQTLRYIRPPETIITQIDVYTEEKFEDEEDLRERTRTVYKDGESSSELEASFMTLNDFATQHEVLRPSVTEALQALARFLSRETAL